MRNAIQRRENMKEEKILLEKCVKIVLLYVLHPSSFLSLTLSLSIFSLSLCTAPLVCLQGQFVSICSSYRVCWANWSQFRALAGNLGGSGWQLATLSGIKIYGPPMEMPSFTTAVTTTLLFPLTLPFSLSFSFFSSAVVRFAVQNK